MSPEKGSPAPVAAQRLDIARLFSLHRAELLRFLQRCLGGRADGHETAADLVQDSFIRLADSQAVASGTLENPRAMLFRIARNLAIDSLRRHRVVAQVFAEGGLDETMAATEPSPEAQVLDRDLLARLEGALAGLPPMQRRILTMKRLQGLSHAEIAAETGLSPAAIEKNLTRALQRLRRALGEAWP